MSSYTIYVCPEHDEPRVRDDYYDYICPVCDMPREWREEEVIPRTVADELAAALDSCPWTSDKPSAAIAKYREVVGYA